MTTKPLDGLKPVLLEIPDHWTPETALAVFELINVARQSGWERQRQSGLPFWRSRRGDDCRGATITQALFWREMA